MVDGCDDDDDYDADNDDGDDDDTNTITSKSIAMEMYLDENVWKYAVKKFLVFESMQMKEVSFRNAIILTPRNSQSLCHEVVFVRDEDGGQHLVAEDLDR